jgi:hypothetical protein
MKPAAQLSLFIAEPAGTAPPSRVRTQFNALIKKLESMRAQLAAWKETMPVLLRQADQEYAPLQREFAGHQKAMVLLLDRMSRQIEQIDPAGIDKLGDEQIRRHNKILEPQVSELEGETARFAFAAQMEMGIEARGRVTPQVMLRSLRDQIDEMRAASAAIIVELEALTDVNELKAWLKTCGVIPRPVDDDVIWY